LLSLVGSNLGPGHYQLQSKEQIVPNVLLAFNGDATESQLQYHSSEELAAQLEQLGWKQQQLSKASLAGKILEEATSSTAWKWLLLAVLVFLFTEILILKFLR
jgi:hypothetical protein